MTKECGCGSTGIQTAKQSAWNEQGALGLSLTKQIGASNKNAPTRVYSDGDDGYVTQSNDAKSDGTGTNNNRTEQTLGQDIAGGGVGTGVQVAGQEAKNKQAAAGLSAAFQIGARNDNSPTRVHSEGDGGMVSQSNSASSTGTGTNGNSTTQMADQGLAGSSCGCGGVGVQALGQKSANEQIAAGLSATIQDFGRSECGCSKAGNSNSPSRVYSDGDDGYVSQANTASSTGTGTNSNTASQEGQQGLGGGGIGVQALGQLALNGQLALGLSAAFQGWPSNASKPTRVYSEGDGGSLSQSNDASSDGHGTNTNGATQHGTQDAPESRCGCEDTLVQALGQASKNGQAAAGLSKSAQLVPSNAAAPTAVWSPEADAVKKAPDAGSAQDALDRAKAELAARQDR
jgi:hypothetical protein